MVRHQCPGIDIGSINNYPQLTWFEAVVAFFLDKIRLGKYNPEKSEKERKMKRKLSQWGMIILSLLLAGTAIFVLRRRLYTG